MRKGKFEKKAQCRTFSSKSVALMLACVLLLGCFVGGTVAWLTAQDTPVVNTFSPSTIGVELKEHTYNATTDKLNAEVTDTGVSNYKMIPGWTIPKDPEVWITENSEAAYLFVEIQESENFDNFMSYAIAEGWKLLDGTEAIKINTVEKDTYVIYREVAAGDTAVAMGDPHAFQILANDQVVVLETVKKEDMPTSIAAPTLTFTAYAHQLYKSSNVKFDVNTAWNNVK